MADHQHYVDADVAPGGAGSSGNPFASLAEWEATVGASASAGDNYAVDCEGVAADTTAVAVDFATTPASITIRGRRGSSKGFYAGPLVISPLHYRLAPASTINTLDIAEPNVTIDGIQVISAHVGANGHAIRTHTSGAVTIRKCRVFNAASCDFGIGNQIQVNGDRTYESNLVVGFDVAGLVADPSTFGTSTYTVYHNTVYGDGAGDVGIRWTGRSGATTVNIAGNAIAGTAGDAISIVATGSSTINSADNATHDSTGQITGISAAAAWTSPGTSATSEFTVTDTNSPLYQVVDPAVVTDDITDTARGSAPHSAGAFELLAGGAYTLQAGEGSFELTGQNVTLAAARKLAVAHGSLAFTGQNVSLRAARKLIAGHGSFALTGQDVTLTFSGQAPTLTAETGQFTLSGQAVVLRAARKLSADAGVFALSGQDVDFLTGKTLTAGHGVFALTGQAVGFKFTRALKAETGVFALTGRNVNLTYSQVGVAEVHGGGWGLTYSQHLKLLARLKKKDESSPRTKLSWSSKPTSSYQNQCRKKSRRLPPPCSWAMGRSSALQRSCPRESARLLLQSSTLISSMNKSERTRKSYC